MSKCFPQDYTRDELIKLLEFHYQNSVKAQDKLYRTREKLIEVQKELSVLKRGK